MLKIDNQTTVIGIDPGYDRMGFALFNQIDQKLTDYGCLQTEKTEDLFARYRSLDLQLEKLLDNYQPQVCAIESLFFFNNQKTALKVSEARGVILNTLIKHNIKIFEYTPLQIKQTVTGYGQADKKAVEKMVRLHFNLLKEKIIDDAIDAIAIIITHQIQQQNRKYYC